MSESPNETLFFLANTDGLVPIFAGFKCTCTSGMIMVTISLFVLVVFGFVSTNKNVRQLDQSQQTNRRQ